MCFLSVSSNNELVFYGVSRSFSNLISKEFGSVRRFEFRIEGDLVSISFYTGNDREVASYNEAMGALVIFNSAKVVDRHYLLDNGSNILKVGNNELH